MQEFTAHYDEFAIYLPEFERLKQVSKMTVIVRLMNSVRENGRGIVAKLQAKLDDLSYWRSQEHMLSDNLVRQVANMKMKLEVSKTDAYLNFFLAFVEV